jgi:hypothetical protein
VTAGVRGAPPPKGNHADHKTRTRSTSTSQLPPAEDPPTPNLYTHREGLPPPSRRRSGRRRGRNPRLNGGEAETTGDSQKVASLVTVEERGEEGDTLSSGLILAIFHNPLFMQHWNLGSRHVGL